MKTRKSILLAAAILLTAASSLCQPIAQDQVPQEVLTAFRAKFPAATDVTWARETNLNYEAIFILATTSQRTEFDKNGAWVETENAINKADLPKNVSNAVLMKNPTCKIADAEEIQSADLGKMYEVGCVNKSGNSDYRITPDGKVVSTLLRKY